MVAVYRFLSSLQKENTENKNKNRAMVYFQQKAVWVTSESGDGRPEEPRYDVPKRVGVKNRYEADLTNQRRGSGSKI